MSRRNETAQQFWARVAVAGPEECWHWLGSCDSGGYGATKWGGKNLKAHRVALALTEGHWASELDVCHRCDNVLCCNPSHLWRGTAAENIEDSRRKGRFRPQDRLQPGAKLTEADVTFVRQSPQTGRALSRKFSVRANTISDIRTRKTWDYLP